MSRVKTFIDPDDVVKLYNSIKSVRKVAKILHCRTSRVHDILVENGIARKNTGKKILPDEEIVSLYNSGMSVNELSRKFQVHRGTILRRLKKANVVIRGVAEANKLMMSKRTPEENARNVRAAHNAIRGKTYTHEELCKHAVVREQHFTDFTSPYERAIANEFTKRGIKFTPQKAIDKYNIDFAIFDNIAFEVYGGGWHSGGRAAKRFSDRCEKIFNCGYTIVICWVGFGYEFIPTAIVDYLVSLNKILSSDPTTRSKHYVIRGDAEICAIGYGNLDYVT